MVGAYAGDGRGAHESSVDDAGTAVLPITIARQSRCKTSATSAQRSAIAGNSGGPVITVRYGTTYYFT
jgi:hypothetical protein